MEPQGYKIIFEGKVVEGVARDTAKNNLQRLFKINAATVEKMFSGKRVVLKKNIGKADLKKYHAALTNAGLEYTTVAESPPAAAAVTATPAPSADAAATKPESLKAQASQRIAETGSEPPDDAQNPYAPPTQDPVVSKEVFCRSCGAGIRETDNNCPKCGTRQMVGKPKSRIVAAMLAIFLGFLGLHRFYLGQWIGLLYLLFGAIGWPIAIIEGIVFLCTGKERWDKKYGNVVSSAGVGLVIAAIIGFVAVIGILAAIALPAYVDYTHRATVLNALGEAQPSIDKIEAYAIREKRFPNSNQAAAVVENPASDKIKSQVVSEGGILTITLRSTKKDGVLDGQTLIWIPRLQGELVRWDCSGGTLPTKYRSGNCRNGEFSGQQTPATSRWVTASDGLTRIRVPTYWKELPDLTEVGSIEYGNLRREHYLAVISETRQDFSSDTDLAAYNELLMEHNYRGSIDNLDIKYLGEISVNGLKGMQYELRGEVNKIKIVYLHTALEGPEYFHQVLFWSLPRKWSETVTVYDTALATFTECKGDCANP